MLLRGIPQTSFFPPDLGKRCGELYSKLDSYEELPSSAQNAQDYAAGLMHQIALSLTKPGEEFNFTATQEALTGIFAYLQSLKKQERFTPSILQLPTTFEKDLEKVIKLYQYIERRLLKYEYPNAARLYQIQGLDRDYFWRTEIKAADHLREDERRIISSGAKQILEPILALLSKNPEIDLNDYQTFFIHGLGTDGLKLDTETKIYSESSQAAEKLLKMHQAKPRRNSVDSLKVITEIETILQHGYDALIKQQPSLANKKWSMAFHTVDGPGLN